MKVCLIKATQLERELEKAKYIKVGLKSKFEKLDHILAGPVRFANDNSGLRYDKFGASPSNSKTK